MPLAPSARWYSFLSSLISSGTFPSLFLVRSMYYSLYILAMDAGSSLRPSEFISSLVRLLSLEMSSGILLNLLFLIFSDSNLNNPNKLAGSSSIKLSLIFRFSKLMSSANISMFLILFLLRTNLFKFLKPLQMNSISLMLLSGSSKHLIFSLLLLLESNICLSV